MNMQIHEEQREFARTFLAMSFDERTKLYRDNPRTIGELLEVWLCKEDKECAQLRAALEESEHESARDFVCKFTAAPIDTRLHLYPASVERAFKHIAYCFDQTCEALKTTLLESDTHDPHAKLLMSQWDRVARSHPIIPTIREFKNQRENPMWSQRN